MSAEEKLTLDQQIEQFIDRAGGPIRAKQLYAEYGNSPVTRSDVLASIWRLIDAHRIVLAANLSLIKA